MTPGASNIHRADQLAGIFDPAIVDIFAGVGGWSLGAEWAFVRGGYRNRYIDLMVNHWPVAVGVHSVNHPMTHHLTANVLEVDPSAVLPGRNIVYLHASPDCTDHSKAKGGKPRRKEIRALADVVVVWARLRRPLVITLENVEEFAQWGPLLDNGQPCPLSRGQEFRRWKSELEALGYVVDHRELRACDYGAPTTRKRLYVVARCDGNEVVWPEKTHGNRSAEARVSGLQVSEVRIGVSGSRGDISRTDHVSDVRPGRKGPTQKQTSIGAKTPSLKPHRTAAECIDWNTPMLSIFATPAEASAFAKQHGVGVPRRPLKENTLKRIARGVMKYVINAQRPFLVNIQNSKWGPDHFDVAQSMPTVTATPKGGSFAVADVTVAPCVFQAAHSEQSPDGKQRRGNGVRSVEEPLGTVSGSNDYAVAAARLAPFTVPRYGEREGQSPRCGSVEDPLPTITGTGNQATLVAPILQTLNHAGDESRAKRCDEPIDTITGANDARALVAAFLNKHRGESPGTAADEPMHTITSGSNNSRPAGAGHAMGVTCAFLSHFYTSNTAGGEGDPNKPAKTITSGGQHSAVTVAMASPFSVGAGGPAYAAKPKSLEEPLGTVMVNDRRSLVAAFMQTYYGNSKEPCACNAPAPTVTGKDRIGLVTVVIDGQTFVITDIAMRMLKPRELARAQGFPDDYIIDRDADGRPISKADQVKLIGNSVCPDVAEAIAYENVVKPGLLGPVQKLRSRRASREAVLA